MAYLNGNRKLKRAWTAEEDEQLRALAMQISPVRLAIRLKRTKSAVVDRAFKLGVKISKSRSTHAASQTVRVSGPSLR